MTRTYRIIDCDQHVNPTADFWQHYLPKHLRELAPRIEAGEDADYVVFEGRRKKLNVLGAQAGRRNEDYQVVGRKSDTLAGGWEADARIADMDRDGMGAAVIYGGGPLGTTNLELYTASFEAYNRWLADFCRHAPDRLAGIAYLPMTDVGASIALMREMAKIGLKGVNIPAFPMSERALGSGAVTGMQMLALTGDPNGPRKYDDPEFHPFWEAAIDLGMSINIHLGARGARLDPPKVFMPDLVMSKLTMAEPIAIMIFGGVFQRYPDLKLVSVESGVGWFAWMTEYMDSIWTRHRHWTKNVLRNPPSCYMDRNVFGSFIHDKEGISNRNRPGGRNIMWSSDYPHSETSFPDSQAVIADSFAGVPEDDQRRMLRDTAAGLYHLA